MNVLRSEYVMLGGVNDSDEDAAELALFSTAISFRV